MTETSDDLLFITERKSNWQGIAVLACAHAASDFYQGALPALLPFLIATHSLSIGVASMMILAFTVAASVTQPVFGLLADRFHLPWLMLLGLLLTGTAIATVGIVESITFMIVLCMVAGIGNALFHPTAARSVGILDQRRPSLSMNIFMIGGQLGFAAGPLAVALTASISGHFSTLGLVVPALLVTLVMAVCQSTLLDPNVGPKLGKIKERSTAASANSLHLFAILVLIVILWSVVSVGIYSFLALYWTSELHQSEQAGGTALTALLLAGFAGMTLGGWLADRTSPLIVTIAGLFAVMPSMLLLLWVELASLAIIAVIPLGISLYAPFAVLIVLGQRYVPTRPGTASGVTMGLSLSAGGLASPILGSTADQHGLIPVMLILAVLAMVGGICALILAQQDTKWPGNNLQNRTARAFET